MATLPAPSWTKAMKGYQNLISSHRSRPSIAMRLDLIVMPCRSDTPDTQITSDHFLLFTREFVGLVSGLRTLRLETGPESPEWINRGNDSYAQYRFADRPPAHRSWCHCPRLLPAMFPNRASLAMPLEPGSLVVVRTCDLSHQIDPLVRISFLI
jgi:hypothetical protein